MIPNQFHFVFGLQPQTRPFHLVHYLCLESCLQVNQPERIFFYHHYEPHGRYWDLIKGRLHLVRVPLVPFVSGFEYKDRFIRQFRYAHHSDFIRLEKLLEAGGVYADMDTLFVRRIPPRLFEKPFVLGRETDIFDPNTGCSAPSLCNALILSAPDAAFGRCWLNEMGRAFDGTWSNHSTLLPQRLSERYPDAIHIEPVESFYKFPGSRQGIADLFERRVADLEGVLSIHLWAHLWWSKLRIDFSTFHAGLITEDYVRHAGTTYAAAARAFLPDPKRYPAAVSPEGPRGERAFEFRDALVVARLFLAAVVKTVAFSLLGERFFPDARQRLGFARQQLAFLRGLVRAKR